MGISDDKNRIRYLSARHVGSAHDSTIFRKSVVNTLFRSQQWNNQKFILGDEVIKIILRLVHKLIYTILCKTQNKSQIMEI